jgi:hypothetical protein
MPGRHGNPPVQATKQRLSSDEAPEARAAPLSAIGLIEPWAFAEAFELSRTREFMRALLFESTGRG